MKIKHLPPGQYYFNETDLNTVHPEIARSCFQLEALRNKGIDVHDLYKIRVLVGLLVSGALPPSASEGAEVALLTERITALYVGMTGPGWNVDPPRNSPAFGQCVQCFPSAFPFCGWGRIRGGSLVQRQWVSTPPPLQKEGESIPIPNHPSLVDKEFLNEKTIY